MKAYNLIENKWEEAADKDVAVAVKTVKDVYGNEVCFSTVYVFADGTEDMQPPAFEYDGGIWEGFFGVYAVGPDASDLERLPDEEVFHYSSMSKAFRRRCVKRAGLYQPMGHKEVPDILKENGRDKDKLRMLVKYCAANSIPLGEVLKKAGERGRVYGDWIINSSENGIPRVLVATKPGEYVFWATVYASESEWPSNRYLWLNGISVGNKAAIEADLFQD